MLASAHKRLVPTIENFARAKERDTSCLESKFPVSWSKNKRRLGYSHSVVCLSWVSENSRLCFCFLGYSCFTMLWSSLLYNEMSQLYVYIYPLHLGPPLTHLGHQKAPNWTPWAVIAGSHYLFYMWQCTYISPNLPVHSYPAYVHVSVSMSVSLFLPYK